MRDPHVSVSGLARGSVISNAEDLGITTNCIELIICCENVDIQKRLDLESLSESIASCMLTTGKLGCAASCHF